MNRLFILYYCTVLICTVFLTCAGMSVCKSTFEAEHSLVPAIISTDKFQHIPRARDTVDCEDGTSYRITDVSRYTQVLADPSIPKPLLETSSLDSLETDAVHFADISGDYLFVKNRYEIIRMLYTLNESAEDSGVCIQFSIPESAVPIVQESWDPDQVIESWNVGHTKICCLEAWDLYKDGAYRRTVYLTAAI